MFHELERLTGMTRLRTTPYHAMGTGKQNALIRPFFLRSEILPNMISYAGKTLLAKLHMPTTVPNTNLLIIPLSSCCLDATPAYRLICFSKLTIQTTFLVLSMLRIGHNL